MDVLGMIYDKQGAGILLLVLVVIGILQILLKVGEFIFQIFKKDRLADKETINRLTASVDKLEQTMEKVMPLMRLPRDVRRVYRAIKILAGDRWPEISEEIVKRDPMDT